MIERLLGRLAACGLLIAAACSASGDRTATTAQPLVTSGFTATPHAARQYPNVVALPDGRVVVADGTGAEIYDPAANTWTSTGPLTAPMRFWSAAVLLGDGRVLLVGGYGPSTYSAAAEILDPATLTWTAAAPMNVAREWPMIARLPGGRVLVAGGLDGTPNGTAGGATMTAEVYDPATNAWTLVGPPTTFHSAQGTAVALEDGRVLLTGSGLIELFDPASAQFTQVGGTAQQRSGGGAALLPGGKVLLFGGYTATSELFDPPTGTFAPTGALASPIRWQPAWTVASDGAVIVAGGDDGSAVTLATVERYDPALGTWASAPSLLRSRAWARAAPLANGRVLVFGGMYRLPPPDQNTSMSISVAETAEVLDPGPCLPSTCADVGAACGVVADGCGGTLACGDCGAGQACSAQHVCVCAPSGACGVRVCGVVQDGCGGTIPCGSCASGLECAADGLACVVPPGTAVLDPALRVPTCAGPAAFCDSGSLLVGRGPIGPEPNTPNVLLAGCADGAGGTFHSDESLDRLRVATVDGGPLRAGATVRVEATVWAYAGYTADYLDLYYATNASSPSWRLLGTLSPTRAGTQVLTATTALGAGERQVIRGQFRYGGSATSGCLSGSFNDRDDLVFAVETPPDTTPPSVGITAPASGGMTVGGDVLLEAVATDDVAVDRVEWYVVPTNVVPAPDPVLVGSSTVLPYSVTWNSRPFHERFGYTILARAYDAAGNQATSAVGVLVDNDGPTLVVDDPQPNGTVTGTVAISVRASDLSGVASVSFYDGTALIATDSAAPYGAVWTPTGAGLHTLRVRGVDGRGNSSEVTVPVTVKGASIETAVYDALAKVPACGTPGAGCDSGTLLAGRATLGPEAHAPNTIGGTCLDGTGGAFHSDESLDALRVEPVAAGGAVRAGASVKVSASVWAYSSSDVLDVYYAADASAPAWTLVGTVTATKNRAAETLSVSFPLASSGAARQAIRGVFRYGGTRSSCPTGSYDDKDDLIFTVQP
jgi:hypothetical protein